MALKAFKERNMPQYRKLITVTAILGVLIYHIWIACVTRGWWCYCFACDVHQSVQLEDQEL
jgi:hypothetical protein